MMMIFFRTKAVVVPAPYTEAEIVCVPSCFTTSWATTAHGARSNRKKVWPFETIDCPLGWTDVVGWIYGNNTSTSVWRWWWTQRLRRGNSNLSHNCFGRKIHIDGYCWADMFIISTSVNVARGGLKPKVGTITKLASSFESCTLPPFLLLHFWAPGVVENISSHAFAWDPFSLHSAAIDFSMSTNQYRDSIRNIFVEEP